MAIMSGLLLLGVFVALFGLLILLTQVFRSSEARSRIITMVGFLLVVVGVIWVSGLLFAIPGP